MVARLATVATNGLIARLPPLPIEVARHLECFVIRRAGAFTLFDPVVRITYPWTRRGAIPIEARTFIVVLFNVDAVAILFVVDQPLTADVALDFYRVRSVVVITALAGSGYIVWIPPIG